MKFDDSQCVVERFIKEYFFNKSIDGILTCVTDDIKWIGSEVDYSSHGKAELQQRLIDKKEHFKFIADFLIRSTSHQNLGEDYNLYTIEGTQRFKQFSFEDIDMRVTIITKKTDRGWLINNIHISISNVILSSMPYKEIIKESPVGVFIAECKTRHSIYVNKAAIEILKHKKDVKVTGKSVVDYLIDNNRTPLLTQEDVDSLEYDKYKEYVIEYDGLYIGIKAKKIYWEEKEAYILFITDETTSKKNTIQLQSLINQVPTGIAVYDIDDDNTQLIYINDAYYSLIGENRNNRSMFEGKNHFRAVYNDDLVLIDNLINNLKNGSNQETVRYRVKVGEHQKWIQLSANVVSRIGTYIKVYASFTDCDIMMRAEKEIELAKKKEENLINSIPGGSAIYRLKKDGRITADYISKSFANMLGYKSDELFAYIKNDITVNIIPEDIRYVENRVKDSLDNSKSINLYCSILNKDKMPIQIRFEANVLETDLKDDDQAVLCAVHTIVSEETKLILNEQKLYIDLLDALDIALFEWDKDKGFYSTEKYQHYAMSKSKPDDIFCNSGDFGIIHTEDLHSLTQFYDRFQNKAKRNSVTLRMKKDDGSFRWTEMLCLNKYDENGNNIKILGVLRDVDQERIEQNKRLNKALKVAEQANQEKTNFLSRVSHDMRTPLNGILGLTMLIKENIEDKKVLNDLDQLEISGKYLLELINDTLDVSRIENGKFELKPTVCDGRVFFNNIINLAMPAINQKNIKFNISTSNIPFTLLYIDGSRMSQVLLNVLGNAAKFTPEGGTIDLKMENISVNDGVITDRITITDTGIGISDDFLPNIFKPFSQEDSSSNNSRTGTGLGMAITKQILEMSGGSISVESQLGKGTTFTLIVKMPIATDEQIEEWKNNELALETINYDFNGKRILLCEDHPLNAQIALRVLSSKGIIVEIANNGKIGLDMFKKSNIGYYDAILMDIRMPEMDGIEATKLIRAVDRNDAKTIPIIAMTANAFAEDIDETKNAGMNAHLSKPIDNRILFETLGNMICKHKDIIKPNVLIVDDVAVNRVVIQTELENDYNIYIASNGIEAKKVIEDVIIDVVITDIQMPQMDGFELIKWIRSDTKRSKMIIIANTQFGDVEQEEKLLAIGANDFVYKPTTPKIVSIRVHNSLRRY